MVTQVGLIAPPAGPTVTGVSGSTGYHSGTFTVVYTYVTAAGETAASASSNVSIASTNAIQVSAISGIPSYVTSLKFYFTAAPAGDTTGFIVSATPSSGTVSTFNLTVDGNGTGAPNSSPSTGWVVTRGVESTSPAAHNNGAPVVHTFTSGAIGVAFPRVDSGLGLLSNLSLGTTAGQPTTGTYTAGTIYVDTNGVAWICTVGGTPGTWVTPGSEVRWNTQTLGSSAASISVTLPTTGFSHVRLVLQGRCDVAGTGFIDAAIRLNNATSYARQRVSGNGATAGAIETFNANSIGESYQAPAGVAAGVYNATEVVIFNFLDTGKIKVARTSWSIFSAGAFPPATGQMFTGQDHGWWNSTAAVTTVSFVMSSGNFVSGSKLDTYVQL